MSPRRHWLPLLSALALLLTPFALAPQAAEAQTNVYLVDTLSDGAGFTCTTANLADSDCSLRQALTRANTDSGASTINFFAGLYGGEIVLADPDVPLPTLAATANNTIINASAGGLPRIAINGNGSLDNGLTITGSDIKVIGLSIYGFTCSNQISGGVMIEGGARNSVESSYIGISLTGALPPLNQRGCNGVVIRGDSSNNTVSLNTISGNQFDGVLIQDATDNRVIGNTIGLAPNSDTPVANSQNGVHVLSTATQQTYRNTIGGTGNNEPNVIAGNGNALNRAGIRISGSGTLTTTVSSNYIGTNNVGSIDRGNSGDGILVSGSARATTITGQDFPPLVISGNDGNGIRVTGGASNTTITSVYVGANGAGGTVSGLYTSATIPNALDGIRIDTGATGTTITGGSASNRTIIAGNGGRGVVVDGASTASTRIENSLIGVAVSGTTSTVQANAQGGVLLNNARTATIIDNTISGNTGFGLRLSGTDTVTVTRNFVGLSLNRKAAQGNAGPGIQLWNTKNTLVGGVPASTPDNYVAGNAGPGVVISGTTSLNITLRSNQIGLIQDPAATTYFTPGPNAGEGIIVTGGARTVTIDGNIVGANAASADPDYPGIRVQGDNSIGLNGRLSSTNVATVTITANRVGWKANGQNVVALPNGDGIAISGRVESVNVLTNTIRLNQGAGVRLTDALTSTVRGNSQVLNNLGGGVVVEGASRNLLIRQNTISDNGRSSAGAALNATADGVFLNGPIRGAQVISNTIRNNTGRGIALQGNVDRATLRYNALALNGGPIRLVGTTLNGGNSGELDNKSTPNHDIDPPIVDLSFANRLSLRVNQVGLIEGYVYTSTQTVKDERNIIPASACITCTIQIFRPDRTLPNDTQGWELIRTLPEVGTTQQDAIPVAANGRFAARINDALPGRLILIATDGYGNSSEYATLPITASLAIEPVSGLAQSAAPGDTVTYTLRLRNTGTLGYSNLQLSSSGTLARWTVGSSTPLGTNFTLNAGATRLVTVTLKLPTGSDPNVVFGKQDRTTIQVAGSTPTVTASAQLVTTVLPRAVVAVVPAQSLGSGTPTTQVPHSFTITNSGNVTVTLDLAYRTVDPANSPGVWATRLSNTTNPTTTFIIPPGGEAKPGLIVTVPEGALQNASATTFLTATVRPGTSPVFPGQTITFSAVTRAELVPNADLFQDEEGQGGAGGTVSFVHSVQNKSNGTAKFCLDYFSASQSTVRFESASSQFVVDASGCFTLYAGADVSPSQGRYNLAQIRAVVTLDRRLTAGDRETVTVFLRKDSPTGESISDASVEERITINASTTVPRLWLPLLRQQ